MFSLATGMSLDWYLSFPLVYKIECNEKLLISLLDKGTTLELSEKISCRPTEVIGRPDGYTFLISTLVGSCGVVFSFYANSGAVQRREENNTIKSVAK